VLSLIAVVFLPVMQCAAAPVAPIVYVAGDGSGDYNCDGIADNVEINAAIQHVLENEGFTTVYLKGPFTYDIAASVVVGSNVTLEGDATAVLKASAGVDMIKGTSGASGITIRGFTLDGSGPDILCNGIVLSAAPKNASISNMSINNMGRADIKDQPTGARYGIWINKAYSSEPDNIKIFNNHFTECSFDALDLFGINGLEIYGNDILTATVRYPNGMRLYQVANVKIYDNIIRMQGAGYAGIQLYNYYDKGVAVENIDIYNNQFIDIRSAGIHAYAGRNDGGTNDKSLARGLHIHHNIFRNTGTHPNAGQAAGIWVQGFDGTIIEHNIFDGCRGGAVIAGTMAPYIAPAQAEPYLTVVRNNIIVNSIAHTKTGDGHAIVNLLTDTHAFAIDNNLVYNNAGDDYVAVTPNSSISADPLFADAVAFDYHLKSKAGRWDGTTWVVDEVHSPCIDAGSPTSDFANEPADNGGRVNIGLYGSTQYASKSVRQLAISDPASDGAFVGGIYQVTVSAGEYLDTAASVDLQVDDAIAATAAAAPYTFTWDTTTVADGSHALSAVGQLQQVGGPAYSLARSVTVDNTAPTVTITDPGAVPVNGTYEITATASDANGIKEVRFLVDDVLLGADDSAPYAYAWDTTTVSDGAHTITARAVDMAGNTKDATATIRVNNTGAIFFIESPTDKSFVKGSVPITVTPTGIGEITKVEFKVGDTVLGEDTEAPYVYTWDTTAVTDGSYTITVNVTNDSSVVTSQNISVTVDNTAPTLQITAPANGATVKGTVTISVNVNDINGIASVSFKVGSLEITDAAALYSIKWDTTKVDNGDYTITVTAKDVAGNATSASITVTTDNVFSTTDAIGHGPNPASSSVTFYFNGVSGTLRVYDISGRLVWSKPVPTNTKQITWDLKNLAGKPLANGLYFYVVVDADGKASTPLQLVIAR
jgi:hypothetical protein